jgi:hypothetical protein
MFLNAVLFPDQVLILEALLVLGVLWCVLRRLTGGLAGFLLFFVSVLVPPLLLGLFLPLCGPGGFLRLQALLIGQEVFCLLRGLLRDPFLLEALRALFGSFLFLQPLLLCGVGLPTCSGASFFHFRFGASVDDFLTNGTCFSLMTTCLIFNLACRGST